MRRDNLLLLLFFLAACFSLNAQQEITLHDQETLIASNAYLYDLGGEQGAVPNEVFKATVKAPTGYIHFFRELDLSSGSQLRFFNCKDPNTHSNPRKTGFQSVNHTF